MVITVDEAKAHLRVQYEDEDSYIASLIEQVQSAAEDYCRVTFDENAPQAVRLAVLLMVSHYYENRDNPDKQVYLTMRMAFENLLYPHRDMAAMF
jgi:uncharacterized phage protein (predicted DNA packaging)